MSSKDKKILKDKLFIDVYEYEINIGVCIDHESLENHYDELRKEKIDNLHPADALTFFADDGSYWVLFVVDKFTLNTCAHECFHITHGIMEMLFCTFDMDDHEPHAWLHGFLVEKMYEIVNNLNSKINKK